MQLYRVEDECKMKTYEFRLSICFYTTTLTALALFVLHNDCLLYTSDAADE